MKRFLCFLAAIVSMLIYCAAPLIAHAESVDLNSSEFFYSYEQLENTRLSISDGERFFEFQFFELDSSSFYADTYGVKMSENYYQDHVSISVVDTTTTISFDDNLEFMLCYKQFGCSDLDVNNMTASSCDFHDIWSDDGTRSRSSFPSFSKIVIDSSNSSIRFYTLSGSEYLSGCKLHDFRTNFDDIGPDLYDIDVSFSPDLSGNVDRKINGNVSEELSITVENHSRFDVQVLMTIVPRGGSLNFYDRTDDAQDKQISSVYAADSEFSFVWWSDEWNYNFDSMIQTSSPHAHHANFSEVYTCSKQYGACPWHFVASGRSVTHKFNWSQIDLVEYGQYDVLVYAIRCDCGIVSRQAAYDDADYFVDYSNIQLVYSSSFTLTNGYKFDLNDYSNGNYPVHSSAESINLGWSSKGYVDKDTGETVIKDKKLSDYLDKQHEIQNRWNLEYSQNVYTDSSGSVSPSLKSHFDSFLGFVNYIFNRLPGDVHSIYIYGFVCIVVLGIIFKVVRS